MSESHSETMNGSGVFETGGQFERPKSRLPRLPQPTPKPPETEAADLMQAVKSVQKAASASQLENKVNTHAVSVRQYLETNVVPILMKGLLTVVRKRKHYARWLGIYR